MNTQAPRAADVGTRPRPAGPTEHAATSATTTAAARTTAPSAAEAVLDVAIPHDCEPATATRVAAPGRDTTGAARGAVAPTGRRLIGVDAARGLALLGMMAVHILSPVAPNGDMSVPFMLASGKSAALFAVVAGVGIAFATGSERRPQGRRWVAGAASLVVRALLITAIGLLLGAVVPIDAAAVILPYYGILFLLAIPLLSLSVRSLAVVGLVAALVIPVLSHVLRADMVTPALTNPTFGQLASDPAGMAGMLALTGVFPALPWLAYIAVGLAVGRSRLTSRGAVLRITLVGVALAAAASAASWLLLVRLGGKAQLEAAALSTMPLSAYTELRIWGADGTVPTSTPWWLAVLTPHSTTPLDLLYTTGIALAAIGVAILLGRMAGGLLAPLATAGRMPLTLYSLHLLMLVSPLTPQNENAIFGIQVVVLVGFAMLWSRRFSRGPLEQALWWASHRARELAMGVTAVPARRPSRAPGLAHARPR